jgi:hypothetical protein
VEHGHKLLVEERGSYVEEPGDAAGVISGTTGGAHEDSESANVPDAARLMTR